MTRVSGWERRLDDAVAWHAVQPFAWGLSDCFLVFWDGAAACIGGDAMPWPRPKGYATSLGAARRLRRHGYHDVGAALAVYPDIAPSFARRGDGGLIRGPDGGLSAGIFTARGFFTKGVSGPVFLSPLAVTQAFRIG